jgi:aspartyl-tRNA(Asn)/glutamyl-tRNA(Gln) amidotransferase subunit A
VEQTDRRRSFGIEDGPLSGVVLSIKDLFDIRGETTMAGSRVMGGEPPALRDAEVVRRLRGAGVIIIGRTGMTEFAFSGLGINPRYGTPANPWQRAERRIPGGSSSGAAVSVTDRMADAAIGTDTGGSVRIPAALCGLVGFKPTAKTVPLDDTLPLSSSYDSVGPIAKSVGHCASSTRFYQIPKSTRLRALRDRSLFCRRRITYSRDSTPMSRRPMSLRKSDV